MITHSQSCGGIRGFIYLFISAERLNANINNSGPELYIHILLEYISKHVIFNHFILDIRRRLLFFQMPFAFDATYKGKHIYLFFSQILVIEPTEIVKISKVETTNFKDATTNKNLKLQLKIPKLQIKIPKIKNQNS